jgi:hypothetical protein
MSSELFEAVSTAVLALYLFAAVWTRYRGPTLLLAVNVLTAITIVVYNLNPIRYFLEDEREMAIVAFEVLAVIAAPFAFRGNRPALYFSYAAFAINLCVVIAATYLAFFFRITRLI